MESKILGKLLFKCLAAKENANSFVFLSTRYSYSEDVGTRWHIAMTGYRDLKKKKNGKENVKGTDCKVF